MSVQELFKTMLAKTGAGEDTVLATVVADAGSSPRSAGAHMLVDSAGRVCGTIGGGAVEYRAVDYARLLLERRQSQCKTYRLRRNDEEELGMLCGGDMEVFFQFIRGGDETAAALMRDCLSRLERDEDLWLCIDLGGGGCWSMALYGAGTPLGAMGLDEAALAALAGNRSVLIRAGERRVYGEPVNRAGKVFIFGGGHVAQALEPALTGVGFRCVVFDSREEYVSRELFPSAWDLIAGDYERVDQKIQVTPNDYIVIVTHAWDLAVLRQLVSKDCAYIGVIGSKTKAAAVKGQLLWEGADERLLARVRAPVGLPIRSETPGEIAISIAAEMILCRAERRAAAPKKPPPPL
jgi:xanthine dehydrogenase accessory factor